MRAIHQRGVQPKIASLMHEHVLGDNTIPLAGIHLWFLTTPFLRVHFLWVYALFMLCGVHWKSFSLSLTLSHSGRDKIASNRNVRDVSEKSDSVMVNGAHAPDELKHNGK